MIARLVTHSGMFHADDVFAAATLRVLAPQAPLLRTRDAEALDRAREEATTAMFDVGDAHEPERNNFDHHQRGFTLARDNGVPFAAFGLVWAHHGTSAVARVLAEHEPEVPASADFVDEVHQEVERRLVWAVDAADCGVLSQRAHLKAHDEVTLSLCNLSRVVSMYNPPGRQAPEVYDEAFERALQMASTLLVSQILSSSAYLRAAHVVAAADDGAPILLLERYVPWQDHVQEHHRFVLSPALDGSGWMVETVQEDFVPRQPLPQAWAGLREEELAQASGVADAIFCHRARFIAAARSKAGALALARLAMGGED